MHQRQVCKEEEEAIKVDLHEGKDSPKASSHFSLAEKKFKITFF